MECFYCHEKMTHSAKVRGRDIGTQRTADHLWPKKYGGYVLVDCCKRCNALKADIDPVLFFKATAGRWNQCPPYPFTEHERKAFLGKYYRHVGQAEAFSHPPHKHWLF